jgi:DNA primase catalytic core
LFLTHSTRASARRADDRAQRDCHVTLYRHDVIMPLTAAMVGRTANREQVQYDGPPTYVPITSENRGRGAPHSQAVMSLKKLTAGDGYTYLTRQVAAHDATNRGYSDLGAYYSDKGETPGVWMGRGLSAVPDFPIGEHVTEAQMRALFGEGRHPNADAIERAARAAGKHHFQIDQASRLGSPYPIHQQTNMFHRRSAGAYRDYNTAHRLPADTPVPAEVRARIRTDLARRMFVETYARAPVDARELSGHLARISRQATTAVAGYDLTFSPVKTVSTLWAIAPRELAALIEQCHHQAVKDTLTWLEDHATYTRRGKHGVAQVKVVGLIAAAFTHRDSRAGDPDLHTHVAISNKVQTLDGRWLALDGRPIHKKNVTASERYNTRLEALLVDRAHLIFAERPSADPSKQPVREIVGIDGDLPRQWSRRRTAIDVRRAVLSARFQTDHGRPPTPNEARELAHQANFETRQNKHEPRSHAEQRTAWRAEARAVLGGEQQLRAYIGSAIRPGTQSAPRPRVTTEWVDQTARSVIAAVQSKRAVWQIDHVRAEAERRVNDAGVRYSDLDHAVDAIVARALSPHLSVCLDSSEPITEPAPLRRSDGTSVYQLAESQLYTSPAVLAAERAIVTAAGRRGGKVVSAGVLDLCLLETTANRVPLNPGQVQLVRELATSGARVQLALAPAGTGKTTAMQVLARAWTEAGGTIIGLAPSAAAAAVLREEINAGTDTLAKLIHALDTGQSIPPWVTSIGPDTLVIIDEAGMAGTPDLAAAIEFVLRRGASVRLIGDNQQLAAIGAGGVLRDVAEVHGAVTLSQVVRFTDPATGAPNHAEGAASLALRDGDPAALAYYIDHQRVHVGDLSTVTDDAYAAWSRDRDAGGDAIMLAPTRDLVNELNPRARRDRLATQPGPAGAEVGLADASVASAGDAIITRRNHRTIPIGARDWVKNGDRFTIERVHDSGALNVIHRDTGRRITLPAGYVARHVSLGYATTVHAAQGITADTCHVVATGDESRQLLYVAMTRGRHANHIYLTTAGDGDPHTIITRDALLPPTAVDVLTRVLAHDDAPVSATSQQRELANPAARLATAADRYHDALGVAAADVLQRRHGPDALSRIDAAAEAALPGLTRHDAYPALRAHLALCAVDGPNPARELRAALNWVRDLDDARDLAAVLNWRIDPTGRPGATTAPGPLPWLPAVPAAFATDPAWGRYLRARAERVHALSGVIADQARRWTPTSAPTWARAILDRDPDLAADLAVWRAANSVEDTDRRPTGPALPAAAEARAQAALDQRLTELHGDPRSATTRWAPLAASIDERITADPFWPTLAERLTAAARAGIHVAELTNTVAAVAPLPDEQPAAALWWRLARHLSPAAISATDHSESDSLRPEWVPELAEIVGPAAADRVLADPAWPALVAAVTHAQRARWEPREIIGAAYELLVGGQPDDQPLRRDELATALAWRIGMLTDPHTPQPTDQHQHPPTAITDPDLAHLPDASAEQDEHWLASLAATEPDHPDEPEPEPHQPSADAHPAALGHRGPVQIDLDQPGDAPFALQLRGPRSPTHAKLIELNQHVLDFFRAHYHDAWAAAYVTSRLGDNLARDERVQPGYAPAAWTALTEHLRSLGATDSDIVAAGLGSHARTGRVIDRFRDRLVAPIYHHGELRGFIGRRNPARSDDDRAGPKYLNTAETDLYHKGDQLYAYDQQRTTLDAGATPVIVEGLLDAWAITLAGERTNQPVVGLATLGTAFTEQHANQLQPHLGYGRPAPIVAFDPDPAGRRAADAAYWKLTARGAVPGHLVLPDGVDPAELYQHHGPDALATALQDSVTPLARSLIDQRMAFFLDRLHEFESRGMYDAEDRVFALRRAAEVIAALPKDEWYALAAHVAERTGQSVAELPEEIIAARNALRTRPPHDPQPRPTGQPPTTSTNVSPTQRWWTLAHSINPELPNDPHWPALANSIERAAANGIPVAEVLPFLASDPPLPQAHRARSLEFRLVDASGDELKPSRRKDDPLATAAALHRRTVTDERTNDHRTSAAPRPASEQKSPTRPPSTSPPTVTQHRPTPSPRR